MLNRYYYQSSGAAEHGSDTFYVQSGGGRVASYNADYATARAGSGSLLLGAGSLLWGQLESGGTYYCYECMLAFDLTSIPSGATITSATFSGYPNDVATTNAYTIRLRAYDWGPTLATSDFVAGASLSSYTLLADLATTSWTAGAYRAFNDVALAANLVPGAVNYFVISSSLHEAGTQPGAAEDERLEMQDYDEANPAKLDVVW